MSARSDGLPWWHPVTVLATWFWTGLLPKAPGTWGSLAALPFAWIILDRFGAPALLAGAAALFAVGCWAAGVYARAAGRGDPGAVVVDEVVGQWLALCAAAPVWWQFALGFALFRLFDIAKPWPIGWCDARLPGGFGIMVDDVLAGLYALVAMLLIGMAVGGPGV